jgi:hypothetical protein
LATWALLDAYAASNCLPWGTLPTPVEAMAGGLESKAATRLSGAAKASSRCRLIKTPPTSTDGFLKETKCDGLRKASRGSGVALECNQRAIRVA